MWKRVGGVMVKGVLFLVDNEPCGGADGNAYSADFNPKAVWKVRQQSQTSQT